MLRHGPLGGEDRGEGEYKGTGETGRKGRQEVSGEGVGREWTAVSVHCYGCGW